MRDMAKKDYKSRTGIYPAGTEADVLGNGSVSITLYDDSGNVLDKYLIDPETGVGITEGGKGVELPQTGMSGMHKALAGLAAMAALTGCAFILFSRKEDEDE